jgi:hypothetical protein
MVIPPRDEVESLPATLEHLHLEFTLNNVPHEIAVVDDGSKETTRLEISNSSTSAAKSHQTRKSRKPKN